MSTALTSPTILAGNTTHPRASTSTLLPPIRLLLKRNKSYKDSLKKRNGDVRKRKKGVPKRKQGSVPRRRREGVRLR